MINVLLLALFYAWRAGAMLAVGGAAATAGERALVMVNVVWVAAAWGLVALALARWRRAAAALWWAILWWLVIVDSRVFLLLGVHLESSVVTRTLRHEHALAELQLGAATLLTAAALFAVLAAVEWLLLLLRRRWEWAALAALLVAAGAVDARARGREAAAVAQALPFAELPDLFPPPGGAEVHYPVLGEAPRVKRPLNVLVLLVESLRADAIEAMPHLRQFAAAFGNVRSRRHYAGAHSTEYATFSLLYGLSADHQVAFTHAPVTPSWPLALLRLNGYDTRAASASFLSDWNQSGVVMAQLGQYRELAGEPAWKSDRRVVEYARDFARTRDRARPFFLFLFFNSTHHAYSHPPEWARRLPEISEKENRLLGDDGRARVQEVRNRYLNSVEYVDDLLGQVLEQFAAEIARGELLVVVTGDHGEELWDRGLYGHAAPTLTNARILVPLVMHVPGEAREVPLSAHADLMPTIVEALRLDPPVLPAVWSTGESLLSAPPERRILVHASGYPYGDRGARVVCAVDGQRKLRLRREPGRVPRFTLVSATDLDDQPATAGDLTALREELALKALRFIR